MMMITVVMCGFRPGQRSFLSWLMTDFILLLSLIVGRLFYIFSKPGLAHRREISKLSKPSSGPPPSTHQHNGILFCARACPSNNSVPVASYRVSFEFLLLFFGSFLFRLLTEQSAERMKLFFCTCMAWFLIGTEKKKMLESLL